MLERISDLPDSVVGIRALGEVTGDDYRNVLTPAVEDALEGGHKVRLLYVLGEDVKGLGLTAGAAWQDTKIGLGITAAGKRSLSYRARNGSVTQWTSSATSFLARSRLSRLRRRPKLGPGYRTE